MSFESLPRRIVAGTARLFSLFAGNSRRPVIFDEYRSDGQAVVYSPHSRCIFGGNADRVSLGLGSCKAPQIDHAAVDRHVQKGQCAPSAVNLDV